MKIYEEYASTPLSMTYLIEEHHIHEFLQYIQELFFQVTLNGVEGDL